MIIDMNSLEPVYEKYSEEHLRNWLIRVAVNECKRVSLSSWVKKKVSLEEYSGQIEFEPKAESRTAVTTRLLRGREKLKQDLLEVWKDE